MVPIEQKDWPEGRQSPKTTPKSPTRFREEALLSLAIIICVLRTRDLWFNLGAISWARHRCLWNGMPMVDLGSMSPWHAIPARAVDSTARQFGHDGPTE
jgi:hypothetical protein